MRPCLTGSRLPGSGTARSASVSRAAAARCRAASARLAARDDAAPSPLPFAASIASAAFAVMPLAAAA